MNIKINPRIYLPFLRWFPLSGQNLRADVMAGITVALVLVPQSMAYAQLAGLPVVYGLYAALTPVIIGALFGNFSLLHTGPVAMLSLMSAAAIAPFALSGSQDFIALSIVLALMVGVLRLLMGLFKLGSIVNLVSHPVLIGFTNAAALIIGLSQLRFVLDLPSPGTGSFLRDVTVLLARWDQGYAPAVAFALGSGLMMWLLFRWLPKAPAVLFAVVFGTGVSAVIGYENVARFEMDHIADTQLRGMIDAFADTDRSVKQLADEIKAKRDELQDAETARDSRIRLEALRAEIHVLETRIDYLQRENSARRLDMHAMSLVRTGTGGGPLFYRENQVPPATEITNGVWRFQGLKEGAVVLTSGGSVVGNIPEGLPSFEIPTPQWGVMFALLPAAFVMALIGFMEATSVSKALAAKTHERIDTNKELVGQGLANIVGAFFQSYVVSGSFSRSAVGGRAGAKTGMFAVVSALVVVLVLLFLTPYLYHLPKAVLAMVVMMAVFGLIRIKPLIIAWRVQRTDFIAGVATFAATLAFAPDIANGILVGMMLSAMLFLLRTMKPRIAPVGRKDDGSIGGIDTSAIEPIGRNFVAMRFDRSLNYLNVAAFEDTVLELLARFPSTRGILVISSGINEIDASGADKVREMADRLQRQNIVLMFSSLKTPVSAVFRRAGLFDVIGSDNVYPNKETAVKRARERFDLVTE